MWWSLLILSAVPVDPCGDVPTTGRCVDEYHAEYCDADGQLVQEDCGNKPCVSYTKNDIPYERCYPCPDNAYLTTSGHCYCIPTYVATDEGCVRLEPIEEEGDGGVGDGTVDPCPCDTTWSCDKDCACDPECTQDADKSKFGCASTDVKTSGVALFGLFLGLALLRTIGLRRRQGNKGPHKK
jgi:hypothetical protein